MRWVVMRVEAEMGMGIVWGDVMLIDVLIGMVRDMVERAWLWLWW